MSAQSKWRNHFQENKTLFIMLAVGLFLIELEIFAMAAMKSGRDERLQVLDQENLVVYASKTATLDGKEKAEFESTFGPLFDGRSTGGRPGPVPSRRADSRAKNRAAEAHLAVVSPQARARVRAGGTDDGAHPGT